MTKSTGYLHVSFGILVCAIPLAHDLVSIWKVATRILHLRRVGVADLVVCASVVGALDHDDVGAGTAQLDGVTLTR